MRASPFLIEQAASGQALHAIGERELAYDEAWLQALLRQHPDILPTAEIEPVFYPLVSIGCEVGTATGSIDNLFISPRGYLVLVETKLWRNPQARREVVAQAIDYASSLSQWTYSRLDEAVQAYLKTYGGVDLDLLGWVEKQHGPVEGGRHYFEETVAKNLRLGRFLTVIVGDRIRQSLVDMLDHVNRYPHLATDVALVEMLCYRWKPGEDWPLLVVPSIIAHTEIVERSIVQVTIKPDIAHQIDVKQERVEEHDRRKRITLTEEAFWEMLEESAPDGYRNARQLVDEYCRREDIGAKLRQSSLVVRLDFLGSERPPTLFFVSTYGYVHVWHETLARQLERIGIDPGLAEEYGTQVRSIMNMPKNRRELACRVEDLNIRSFVAAADAFVDKVRRAAVEQE